MKVVLETTKGDIVLEIHEDWAPIGAAHFIELVEDGFYDGAPWFRVIEGFVAQCGLAANPDVTDKWQGQCIADEPVVQSNIRGTVTYGKSGAPDSRSTHIFINYRDNGPNLDPIGFSAFAEVVEGMDIAESLHVTGDSTVSQHSLGSRGIDYFNEVMPDGDVIKKAYIKE